MECFDNSSSNYLFSKGFWITPGNYSSEPVVVDWLSIFQKYPVSVQWFPGDSSIGKLHGYLPVASFQFQVPTSSLVLSFVTYLMSDSRKPHSVSDGTCICCQNIVTYLPPKVFVWFWMWHWPAFPVPEVSYDAPVFSYYIVCWRVTVYSIFLIYFLSIQSSNRLSHWNVVQSNPNFPFRYLWGGACCLWSLFLFCSFSSLKGLLSKVRFSSYPELVSNVSGFLLPQKLLKKHSAKKLRSNVPADKNACLVISWQHDASLLSTFNVSSSLVSLLVSKMLFMCLLYIFSVTACIFIRWSTLLTITRLTLFTVISGNNGAARDPGLPCVVGRFCCKSHLTVHFKPNTNHMPQPSRPMENENFQQFT